MGRRLTFAPSQGVLRQLRAEVRQLATSLGAKARVGENLALVVDELVNNAIEHGTDYRQRNLDLAIQIDGVGDTLRIEFFDQEMPPETVDELSRALVATSNGMPSLESERGRGLFLLTVYLHDLRVELAPSGGLRLVGHIGRQ